RFWYRIRIGEHVLWAENESRLRRIQDVLTGNTDRNQAALYALPQWLIKGSNRSKAITQIEKMLADQSLPGSANG
ncbi:MAG: hypothetical protein RLN85_02975, partial [Pseudomonadales bacterium]